MDEEIITLCDYRKVLESMGSVTEVSAFGLYKIFSQHTRTALNGIVGRLVTGNYLESRHRDGTTFYRISAKRDLPPLERFLGSDFSEIVENGEVRGVTA